MANRNVPIFRILMALALFGILLGSLAGCTLRTRTGTEYKILEDVTHDEAKPADETEEDASLAAENEFAELSRNEQEELAMTEVEPPVPAGIRDTEDREMIVPEDTSEAGFPTNIQSKPTSTLPLQTRLYPVPASAEMMAFDPERRHRANRKAALELTHEGRRALDAGKTQLAIAKFQKAISVDPKCGYAFYYFARARFIQQDWDQVVALADKGGLHLSTDHVFLSRCHLLKAQALANLKRYVPALAACESAVDADGTNVQAKLLRSKIRNLY